MNVLVIGAGVVGTVYATQLIKAGHAVDVLAHGPRTQQIQSTGLCVTDTETGISGDVRVPVQPDASCALYDLVLISVTADQLPAACLDLQLLVGAPVLLFLGNNLAGRAGLPVDLPGPVQLGFPGIGGALVGDRVEYMRIPPQPTTLQAGGGPVIEAVALAFAQSGFHLVRTADIDGWLTYHAVLLASISSALYRCGSSAAALATNQQLLALMCRSIEEGFSTLNHQGVHGLPNNLRILHLPFLRRIAVGYWTHTMRSPMGESCFAAHCRHAEPEMRSLAAGVLRLTHDSARTEHLRQLLAGAAP